MTTTAQVHRAFHGAAYVHVDQSRHLAVVWDGASTFSVYAVPGLASVDAWTDGRGVADRWAARERAEGWLASL